MKIQLDKSLCYNDNDDNDNDGAGFNNVIFTINDAELHVPVVTLSAKDNQKLSKLLSKGFKRMCIGMIIKRKVRMKV